MSSSLFCFFFFARMRPENASKMHMTYFGVKGNFEK